MKQDNNALHAARATIDRVDAQMAQLFCERMAAAAAVAEYKKQVGLPVFDREREAQVLAAGAARIEDEALRAYYVSYLQFTMALSRKYQHALLQGQRIAFSGVPGAFADIAAARIFPDGIRVPCADFKAAYDAVLSGACECAVLPVENSTNGDVSQVMDLAFSGSLYISGLYDLEIEQCLMGVKGAQLSDIRSVVSHPQALGQCAEYVRRYRWQEQEAVNTAVAAKQVAEQGDRSVAVIASRETAALYGLQILEKKINHSSNNVTRFAVFTRAERAPQPTDGHFAMLFTVKNEAGSLLRAVEAIGENGFNLRSLKSRPTKETNWEYYFYVEGEGSIASPAGEKMTAALQKVCGTLRILGSFGNIRLLHDPENVLHAEPSADALSEASLRAENGEN